VTKNTGPAGNGQALATAGKPKLAVYWAASCGGCDIAILNIGDGILDVDAAFDLVFWPAAMDAKYKDVEAMPDGSITLTLFNGGIRNDENAELAHLLRRKSQVLVAFGSCASEGCIPGLANLSSPKQIFDAAYEGVSTDNPDHIWPKPSTTVAEGELTIPTFARRLRTLDQVVPVDYYIPGCPPESHQIAAVLDVVIAALQGKGELPPKGTTLGAGATTVCDDCLRERHVKAITAFRRIQDVAPADPVLCLLEQGVPCNGPATRNGCGALCPAAGAQCIGCYGPAEGVIDFGARLLSAFASVIDANDPAEIDRILDTLPDPAGQFYRFNLARSLLRSGKAAWAPESAPVPAGVK
jgi:F420-non-reducing hydrogenase small subunit